MNTKVCCRCKIEKEINDFNKNKSIKDGYSRVCRCCENVRLKIYRENNKEKMKEKYKRDKEKNPNYIKEWHKKNPKYNSEYEKKRRDNDPLFYLKKKMRNRLRDYLKYKTGKTIDYIGCSYTELKNYIEKKFVDGMSWENRKLWHIDHIIPLSSAKNEEEIYKLCHYTNLQPLWAEDNLKKGKKLFNNENQSNDKNIIS